MLYHDHCLRTVRAVDLIILTINMIIMQNRVNLVFTTVLVVIIPSTIIIIEFDNRFMLL